MFVRILLSIFIFFLFSLNANAGGWVTQEFLKNNLLEFSVSETVIEEIDAIIDNMSTEKLDILLEKSDILIHRYRHDGFYSAILYYIQFQALEIKNTISVEVGDYIYVHYTGFLIDGEKFDSSYDRWETLDFFAWMWHMISGFDAAVIWMKVGDQKRVIISPDEAYWDATIENNHPLAWETLTFDIEIIDIGN